MMRARRYSSLDQGSFVHDPRPSAVENLLAACVVLLGLVWSGGCPSKTAPDANKPPNSELKTQDPGQLETQNSKLKTRDRPLDSVTYHTYKVIRTYPHDPRAFTQGLVYEDGVLYEGTGLYGESSLTKRNLETGEVLKRERLPQKYFGEGITVFGDKVYQLTWQSRTGFVYDKASFRLLKEFRYSGEGWGLTHDGKNLIMSDGTATLRFLDPNTLTETRRLTVRDEDGPVDRLNELEYVAPPPPGVADSNSQPRAAGPQIFANIWTSDMIAIIAPDTGRVIGWLDLSNLYRRSPGSEAVLNGIAWLPQSKHLLITGKLWPRLYEIELTKEAP